MQTNKISAVFLKAPRASLMREELKNLFRNSKWYLETHENKKEDNDEQPIEHDSDSFKNNSKSEEEKQKDYELQLIFNKISLNSESEKLKLMQNPQGQRVNNIVNGKIIRIQAGILSATEIKRLKMLGYHVEEFKPIESLDAGNVEIENISYTPKSIKITMFPNSKNPPLVEILNPTGEFPLDYPASTVNTPKPLKPVDQPKPLNPIKPVEIPASTPIEQTSPKQPESDRPKEQQIPNGWIDSHNLETNPNMMTASCIVHYYTEEQRNQLEQVARGQLQSMLDQNTHLSQYYAQKDNPSQGSGWNLEK
jgi:hypothetical protein